MCWVSTEWWTATMTGLYTNRMEEKTTSTTVPPATPGLLVLLLAISMDGSETLQKMQVAEDGYQTSSQAGNTDLWLGAWRIWTVTPGILMMGHSKLNISEMLKKSMNSSET